MIKIFLDFLNYQQLKVLHHINHDAGKFKYSDSSNNDNQSKAALEKSQIHFNVLFIMYINYCFVFVSFVAIGLAFSFAVQEINSL